jgi:flagellar hook-basal body complex protein FliE
MTMQINQGMSILPRLDPVKGNSGAESAAKEATQSFGDTLKTAMGDVNALQQQAGQAVDKMVAGQDVDLHDVMLAVEKAKTSFQLLMEIRNKTIDAYRELMRVQV